MGHVVCWFATIEKVIDERSCIVRPQGTMYVNALPILLKGWPTAGKVTGQQENLGNTLFRVTGTSDQKTVDGHTVRIYVLEVANPLVVGDVVHVPYAYADVAVVCDQRSCLVQPCGLRDGDYLVPILLRGWPMAGIVQWQKVRS